MHVIATAGHVDLGFAWTTLPSGERFAFVDVPGHVRFVSNMLAGVGPVPAVMFVAAVRAEFAGTSLASALTASLPAPNPDAPVRLWIDRVTRRVDDATRVVTK